MKNRLLDVAQAVLLVALLVGGMRLGNAALDALDTPPRGMQHIKNMPEYDVKKIDYNQQEFQAIVRLEKDEPEGFFCSGSVISDDYVLTAAHCLVDKNGKMKTNKFLVVSSTKDVEVESIAAGVNIRADYALVKGDFRRFSKFRVMTDTMRDIIAVGTSGPVFTCGYPWGSDGTCYKTGTQARRYYDMIAVSGILYAGMSGGPVIDSGTGEIIAVNSAVTDGYIIVAPLIGLFETLGVKVVK